MGTITTSIRVDPEVYKEFKKTVEMVKGKTRGAVNEAIIEALKIWDGMHRNTIVRVGDTLIPITNLENMENDEFEVEPFKGEFPRKVLKYLASILLKHAKTMGIERITLAQRDGEGVVVQKEFEIVKIQPKDIVDAVSISNAVGAEVNGNFDLFMTKNLFVKERPLR